MGLLSLSSKTLSHSFLVRLDSFLALLLLLCYISPLSLRSSTSILLLYFSGIALNNVFAKSAALLSQRDQDNPITPQVCYVDQAPFHFSFYL